MGGGLGRSGGSRGMEGLPLGVASMRGGGPLTRQPSCPGLTSHPVDVSLATDFTLPATFGGGDDSEGVATLGGGDDSVGMTLDLTGDRKWTPMGLGWFIRMRGGGMGRREDLRLLGREGTSHTRSPWSLESSR